jgi:hypothetical protein
MTPADSRKTWFREEPRIEILLLVNTSPDEKGTLSSWPKLFEDMSQILALNI